MSTPMLNRAFPRAPLFGACGLIVMAIGLAAWGRLAGPASVTPPASPQVAARELRFDDRADGGIVVTDARNEALVEVVPPGTNGFLRSLMRGLARERRLDDLSRQPPFRVTQWADGRVTLDDLSNGHRVELEAFGPTNSDVFARLVTLPETLASRGS